MEIDFLWLGIGLAVMGYFIGDGLKNFKNPKGGFHFNEYSTLVKEKDLPLYINLSKEEVRDLLNQYPDAPKVKLNGTTYYPYRQFIEWIASEEIYKR